jgi:hypothetical protein
MVAAVIAARFDMAALERDRSSTAAIAPDGTIEWANAAWFRFARENGGEHAAIHERDNYFAAIGGEAREAFEAATAECLAEGRPFEQIYECSSADVFRIFRLRMFPIDRRALLLVHDPLVALSHDRTPEPPDEAQYRDPNGLVAQCSNCRATRAIDGSWHWVPGWVDSLPEPVTHVTCPRCRGFYWPPRPKSRGRTGHSSP